MIDTCEFQCKNYELCETNTNSHNSLCKSCMNWGEISVISKKSRQHCYMCNEMVNKKMLFPNNCGHEYCIDCMRYMLFCDETSLFNISPEPFGCPPCPNGCRNPSEGNQCLCSSYDQVIEDWWNENKEKAEEFTYACYLDGKIKIKNYAVYCAKKQNIILYIPYYSTYLFFIHNTFPNI